MQTFFMPTRIAHGPGAIGQLAELCRSAGMTRAFVVTDRNIAATAFFGKAVDALDAGKIGFAVFDGCEIDARLRQIAEQTSRLEELGFDGVVGIGGGSVMCAAKAIGVMATNPGTYADYKGAQKLVAAPLPNIMIPTTAGSGSEVSGVSVVLDDERGQKFAVRDSRQYPTVALLDPMALESCPSQLAVYSALDAFAHAVEGFLSPKGSSVTDAFGLTAAGMLMESARGSAVEKRPDAMAETLLASSMANISFGSTGLGMAHLLAQPLEETYHVPHGKAVGMMLPAFLSHADGLSEEKLRRLAAAFGIAQVPAGGDALLRAVIGRIEDFHQSLGFRNRFGPDEVDRRRIGEMTDKAHAFSAFLVRRDAGSPEAALIASENGHAIARDTAARIHDRIAG